MSPPFFFRIGWRSVANGLASRVILRPPMFALQPEMKIFSGSANRELAQRICDCIGMPLGPGDDQFISRW